MVVLCCLFWCQSIGDVSPYVCSYYLARFRLLSGHLLAKSCSLDRLTIYSLYLFLLTTFDFSYLPFGSEGGIWVLIVPVPGHCILVTF